MKNVSKTFVQLKVFTDRARMYLGYINFFLLNVVFLKSYNVQLFDNSTIYVEIISYAVIGLLGTGIVLFIGYLDHVLGIRREEMQNIADNNPFALKVIEDLEQLKKDIGRLTEYQEHDRQARKS